MCVYEHIQKIFLPTAKQKLLNIVGEDTKKHSLEGRPGGK